MSQVILQPEPKTEEPRKTAIGRPLRSLLPALLVVLCVIAAAVWITRTRATHSGDKSVISATPSTTLQIIRIKGTTEAVESRVIMAPILSGQTVSALTITKLALSGARVKPGDPLVEFDRQSQLQNYIDKEVEYNKLAAQVMEAEANERAARAKDESELEAAENALKKAQLGMQKLELLSRIDSEKAQQSLEETTAAAKQLRTTFDLKRKAAQAGIRILEIQRDRSQQTMKHAQENANLMRITSPIDGIVVLNTIWKQGKMGEPQEGDQLRPGVPFMQVVDPSRMRIRALVNQEDFRHLQVGEPAEIRVDAYPDLVLPGKLEQISPVARKGGFSERIRTLSATFTIDGTDPRLMPDLSAAIDVRAKAEGGSR